MKINNLIARFLANKATKEEWDNLETWKTESQGNLSDLLEMQSIWQDAVDLKGYKDFDRTSAWDSINGQLEDDSIETKAPKRRQIISLKWVAGIAAAVTIAIVALNIVSTDSELSFNSVASNNSVENVQLVDGSNIVLNKNTELNYASDFENNRTVILDGEAYFDVARNESKPFTVATDCANITVLGTSFNIEEKEGYVNVLVTSGSVSVRSGDEEVLLKKNDMVKCDCQSIKKLNRPGNNYLSWKTNKLEFNETPLDIAIADIARHYNVNISFTKESQSKKLPVTDVFEGGDIETVIEGIALITGIKYFVEGNKYIIQ